MCLDIRAVDAVAARFAHTTCSTEKAYEIAKDALESVNHIVRLSKEEMTVVALRLQYVALPKCAIDNAPVNPSAEQPEKPKLTFKDWAAIVASMPVM